MPKPILPTTGTVSNLFKQANKQLQTRQQASTTQLSRAASASQLPLFQRAAGVHPLRGGTAQSHQTASQMLGQLSARSIGATRSYSADLPPTTLISRYKPVLEEAIGKQQEMVELVEQNNFCVASFVTIALNIIPGISSIRLDNGYTITGIKEVGEVENTTARLYELQVNTPDTLDRAPEAISIPITVFKANIMAQPRPNNLKNLLGLCSTALGCHQGEQNKVLNGSIKVFSTTFTDLEALYTSYEIVSDLIHMGYLYRPSALLEAIGNRLKANGLNKYNPYVEPLKEILIQKFKDKYPGHDEEIEHLQRIEKQPEEKIFSHSIEHKGGAYRAAFKLNALANADPGTSLYVTCNGVDEQGNEQTFTLLYHSGGLWLELGKNPDTGAFESKAFAKPDQLSQALKQRKVKSILTPHPLGLL